MRRMNAAATTRALLRVLLLMLCGLGPGVTGAAETAATPPALRSEFAQDISKAASLSLQIDMAGKQRMLSQRMTAAACLINLGINPEQQRLALTESVDLLSASIERLDAGYPLIGMKPIDDPIARSGLDAERAIWSKMLPLIVAIRDYGRSPQTLQGIVEQEPVLLRTAQNLVQALRRGAWGNGAAQAEIRALDLAGRQRMLAFQMLKEACLITTEARAGRETESHRNALLAALDMFEMTAGQLIAGDEGARIAPPPNDAAFAALDQVQLRWQDLRPLFEPALEGEALGPAVLGDLAYDYDALLFDLEEVIWNYTAE